MRLSASFLCAVGERAHADFEDRVDQCSKDASLLTPLDCFLFAKFPSSVFAKGVECGIELISVCEVSMISVRELNWSRGFVVVAFLAWPDLRFWLWLLVET